VRTIAVAPIRVYQRLISPLMGERCRYYPSCSEYAAQAITKFGIPRGLVLAGWRLLRCNPFSRGGYDPVEAQRLFKTRNPGTHSSPGKARSTRGGSTMPSSRRSTGSSPTAARPRTTTTSDDWFATSTASTKRSGWSQRRQAPEEAVDLAADRAGHRYVQIRVD
jgi:putative membrane protein insertion efficiency factor